MSALDLDSVEADDWPRRDFPLEQPRRNRVRVVVRQSGQMRVRLGDVADV